MEEVEIYPVCWKCQSTNVVIKFAGYERAYCKKSCKHNHQHFEDVPQHDLSCLVCGNKWRDGSGDFAELTVS